MAPIDYPVPESLRKDAIVEAVFEIRFSSASEAAGEVLLGLFSKEPAWRNYVQRRLPLADVPQAIRLANQGLKYQPLFELQNQEEDRLVRVGSNSVAVHRKPPYVGWGAFSPEIERLIQAFFKHLAAPELERLGLRYVNGLGPEHGIRGAADLDLQLNVSEERVLTAFGVNYTRPLALNNSCNVKIVTADLTIGMPAGTSVMVDVDVFSAGHPGAMTAEEVGAWAQGAHEQEKREFFHVLKRQTIEDLRER